MGRGAPPVDDAGQEPSVLGSAQGGDGALVGHAGLLLGWDNEKAGLHYWMGVPYWGRDYATEAARELVRHAFEDLGLGRVYADHVARNPASGRVLQKVGMSYEGCRRRDFKTWDRCEDLAPSKLSPSS